MCDLSGVFWCKTQTLSLYLLNVDNLDASLKVRKIREELAKVVHLWFKIGVQLGVPHHKLMEFQKLDDPLTVVIDYWLNGNVKEVTISWKSIVAALKSDHVGETGLARRICKKYCQLQEDELKGEQGQYMIVSVHIQPACDPIAFILSRVCCFRSTTPHHHQLRYFFMLVADTGRKKNISACQFWVHLFMDTLSFPRTVNDFCVAWAIY